MKNINDLLKQYSTIKECKILDNYSIRCTYIDLIREIGEIDFNIGKEILKDALLFIPTKLEYLSKDDAIKEILDTLSKDGYPEQIGIKMILDPNVLELVSKNIGNLVKLNEDSNSVTDTIRHKDRFWIDIFNYALAHNMHNEVEKILNSIELNERGYFVFKYLYSYSTYSRKKCEKAKIDDINKQLILNSIDSITNKALITSINSLIEHNESSHMEFNIAMATLEEISLIEQPELFKISLQKVCNKYKKNLSEIGEYIVNTYYPLINTSKEIDTILADIVTTIFSTLSIHAQKVALMKSNTTIFEPFFKNMYLGPIHIKIAADFKYDKYQHTSMITSILRQDEYIYLDQVFHSLNQNTYLANLDTTLISILSGENKFSNKMIEVLQKWSMLSENKQVHELMSKYTDLDASFANLMESINKYLFTKETGAEDIKDLRSKIDIVNSLEVEKAGQVLLCLSNKCMDIERGFETCYVEEGGYYNYSNFSEEQIYQYESIAPDIRNAIFSIFSHMLCSYMPEEVCKYIRSIEGVYRYLTSKNRDKVINSRRPIMSALSTMMINSCPLTDESIYEFNFYLDPEHCANDISSFISSFASDKSISDYEKNKLLIKQLTLLNSNILTEDIVCERIKLNMELFFNNCTFRPLGLVPYGGNEFLLSAIVRLFRHNRQMAHEALLLLKEQMMSFGSVLFSLNNQLEMNEFLDFIFMDEEILQYILEVPRYIISVFRKLLDADNYNEFSKLFSYMNEKTKGKQLDFVKGINSLTLLKKDVEPFTSNRVEFLINCVKQLDEIPEQQKLLNRLSKTLSKLNSEE